MERTTTIKNAQRIMGDNFIGFEQIEKHQDLIGIATPKIFYKKIPSINYSEEKLISKSKNHILFLGIPFYKDSSPLTVVKMRNHFGINPNIHEPCFYNQDWYLGEQFARDNSFETKWYLLKKDVYDEYRGLSVDLIPKNVQVNIPSTILATYLFFTYYFCSGGEMLWRNEFIWCSDKDVNGDQIYVGRYSDTNGINKNGFNIHRHLKLKQYHSVVDQIL